MLISLSDQIWSRLYGPYGIENVAEVLSTLDCAWDTAIAADLFWEKLHHQDDIYPVTFAALPWLIRIADHSSKAAKDTLPFVSHVVSCAYRSGGTGCDGKGPRGRYRGLSTDVDCHRWTWIPSERHLTSEDMQELEQLEVWFHNASPQIAQSCIAAVQKSDPVRAAMLVSGPLTMHGGENVAFASSLWADGEPFEVILDEVRMGPSDVEAANVVATELASRNADLARFLNMVAAI